MNSNPSIILQNFFPNFVRIDSDQPILGGFVTDSLNARYLWLGYHNEVHLYGLTDLNRKAVWVFEETLRHESKIITCTSINIRGTVFLLVSLRMLIKDASIPSTESKAQLLVLDLQTARTIKIIHVSEAVSSITSLSQTNHRCSDFIKPNIDLTNVHVLGTLGGKVYLLDIDFDPAQPDAMELTCHIQPVDPRFSKQSFMATYPDGLVLPMLHLDHPHHTGSIFEYRDQDKRSHHFSEKKVFVSTMEYIKAIGALAVGFSFGGFQLWSLLDMTLVYAAPIAIRAPISHFAFQQLADDDSYAYLWIAFGDCQISTLLETNVRNETALILMKLQFQPPESPQHTKSIATFFGAIREYTRKGVQRSRIIHCLSIQDDQLLMEQEVEPKMAHVGFRRAVFIWEMMNERFQVEYKMEIFDLEGAVRQGYDSTLFHTVPLQDTPPNHPAIDAWINPLSLRDFASHGLVGVEYNENVSSSSSLSLDLLMLFETGLYTYKHLSAKQQALLFLVESYPQCLEDPRTAVDLCRQVGLLAADSIKEQDASDRDVLQNALFHVALENNLTPLWCKCIFNDDEEITCYYIMEMAPNELSEPTYMLANPRALLEWTWQACEQLFSYLEDHYYKYIFGGTRHDMDKRWLKEMDMISTRLADLHSVLEALLSRANRGVKDATPEGIISLHEKLHRLQSMAQHLEMVMWFYQHGIVRDVSQLYLNDLRQTCQGRRQALLKKRRHNLYDNALLIDHFISSCTEHFPVDFYPPTNLEELLRLFKKDPQLIGWKKLMFYFLLELDASKFSQGKTTQLFAFMLRPVEQNVVYACWLLDTAALEMEPTSTITDALSRLLSINLDEFRRCAIDTQATATKIMRAFHDLAAFSQGLKFVRTFNSFLATHSVEDTMVRMKLLLCNGLIFEAFSLQRSFSHAPQDRQRLLRYFLEFCVTTNNLPFLLQLPFDTEEDTVVVDYLQASKTTTDFLAVYYLSQSKYSQALPLAQLPPDSRLTSTNQSAILKNILVQNYQIALPILHNVPFNSLPRTTPLDSSTAPPPELPTTVIKHNHFLDATVRSSPAPRTPLMPPTTPKQDNTPRSIMRAQPVTPPSKSLRKSVSFSDSMQQSLYNTDVSMDELQQEDVAPPLDNILDTALVPFPSITTPPVVSTRKSARLSRGGRVAVEQPVTGSRSTSVRAARLGATRATPETSENRPIPIYLSPATPRVQKLRNSTDAQRTHNMQLRKSRIAMESHQQ